MLLSEFEWSRNPRGLHVQRILITPLEFDRWTRPHMGWVKLVASEHEYVDDSIRFLELGITPILRPYRARWGAQPMDGGVAAQMQQYASVGVKWFDFYNEPNLDIEWPLGFDPNWQDMNGVIKPLMDNWLVWAEYVISLGCYPGFPPLAESAHPRYSAVLWMDTFLNYLAANHFERFKNVLASGMYVSTHPYILNHFYQEQPGGGPRSARQPHEQNASEGGWHFEYPNDPITQGNDTGRTVYGGTALTPHGDPNGLTAMGWMFNDRCAQIFGSQAVPVVGTEGGIWPFQGQHHQPDNRFPPYNELSQGVATVAMFDWIARQAPPWFFGVCLWKEDEYYPGNSPVNAINQLAAHQPILKDVPPIPVMSGGYVPPGLITEVAPPPGPGPIQGEADYHMIVLAPGLEARWFFDTAQSYWNLFRPIVTTQADLIDLLPNDVSLAATVIAPPDVVDTMTSAIRDQYPNVYLDLIVATTPQEVYAIFNRRALANRRFE